MRKVEEKKNLIVARAGIWYIACNFINKGIAFLTTPIFTRILSKEIIGEFSNYNVWLNIMTIIVTMNMHVTMSRARYDHEGKMDQYTSSISILSVFTSIIGFTIVLTFSEPLIKIMGVSREMLYIMAMTVMFSEAFQVFQVRSQLQYKYKLVAFLTVLLNVSSIVFSLALIFAMDNKLNARLYGFSFPRIFIYICVFIFIVLRGKSFNWSYCRYCLKISLPYIPHLLSLNILSASDRTMIKTMCGAEQTAIYSIGYSVVVLITLLGSSMNQAWTPWFGEQMHNENFKSIRKWSTLLLLLFVFLVMFVGLFAPEIIMVLGGKNYYEAINVMPPLLMGCVFQFAYTFYVNVESFEKKTGGLAIATVISAAVNVGLNYIFIPKYGYVAAAFTTLTGYALLFLIHYFMVRRIGFSKVYNTRLFFGIFGLAIVSSFAMYFMYKFTSLRIVLIVIFISVIAVGIHKYRDQFNRAFKAFFNR